MSSSVLLLPFMLLLMTHAFEDAFERSSGRSNDTTIVTFSDHVVTHSPVAIIADVEFEVTKHSTEKSRSPTTMIQTSHSEIMESTSEYESFGCEIHTPENGGLLVDGTDVNNTLRVTPGQAITLFCHTGFELSGSNTITCLGYGNWSDDITQCFATCGDPYMPRNGHANASCTYENCTATYRCDLGYRLSGGDRQSVCSGSAWVIGHALPNCTAVKCPSPPQIVNGEIIRNRNSSENFYFQDKVEYRCLDNYVLVGGSQIVCNAQQEWTGETPECIEPETESTVPTTQSVTTDTPQTTAKICSFETTIEHGQVLQDGRLLTYVCDAGYRLQGSRERRCLKSGILNREQPTCVLDMRCGEPVNIAHANKTPEYWLQENGTYPVGAQVIYFCLQNDTTRFTLTCGDSGDWEGQEPSCFDDSINAYRDIDSKWKDIFMNNRHWTGSYRYWDQPIRFQLFVLDQNSGNNEFLSLLFDDFESKFFLQVRHAHQRLTFKMSRLLTPSERFLHGYDWSFVGHVTVEQDGKLWISSLSFSSEAFDQLYMTPRPVKDAVPDTLDEPTHNAIVLTFGIILAIGLVFIAAGLAARYARSHGLWPGRGRGNQTSTTSFENPVYDYMNMGGGDGGGKDSALEPMNPQDLAC